MRYFKILLIVLVMGLFSTNAISKESREGPELTIRNSTHETYIVMLCWIDHPFLKETFGKPFNTVGAEMAPGESFDATYRMGTGKFYVKVCGLRDNHVRIGKYFNVGPKDHKLVINVYKHDKRLLIFILRKEI